MVDTMFPRLGRYQHVPASWFDPVAQENLLNEIARASSQYRDESVGGSHVVMQKPALRSRLRPSRGRGR